MTPDEMALHVLELLRSIDASLKVLMAQGKAKSPRKLKEVPMLKHRQVDPCIECPRRAKCETPCMHKDEYDAGQRWLADQHAQGKTGAEGSTP